MSRVLAFLLLLLCAAEAQACRCAQQNLADYFNAADLVFMGELTGSEMMDGYLRLDFNLPAPAYKPTVAVPAQLSALTGASSAECGVPAQEGAIYVVFATQEEGHYRVNSCNGTRIHFSRQSAEPAGFEDVPARFVAQQLNALAGMEVLARVSQNQPKPENPENQTLIGLLDIKALAHGGVARLYSAPSLDSDLLAEVESYEALVSKESDYELDSAVVYARVDDWSRLQLRSGEFGWLPPEDAGTFMPYAQLPIRRLAYLTDAWSGFAWPQPGAGIPLRSSLASRAQEGIQAVEIPVNILESTEVGGMPWFRVELLADNPCEGGEGRSTLSGWIPAFGSSGEPTAWFWSRGC